MAQTTPNIGLGSKVEISPPGLAPPVYAILGYVTDIAGPSETFTQVDITSMLSTSREYIEGIPDGGEIQVTCHYAADNPTHNDATGVLYFARNRIGPVLRITPGNASARETYNTIITKIDRSEGLDSVMKLMVTFKINGAIVVDASGN